MLSVLRGQTKNFLNISVVAGLAWNLALGRGRGFPLPFFLESLFVLLGSAFGPVVLFLGCARNVGAFEQLAALRSVLMPLLTVLLKVLVLPTFVTELAGRLGASREAIDFAFAFSTRATSSAPLGQSQSRSSSSSSTSATSKSSRLPCWRKGGDSNAFPPTGVSIKSWAADFSLCLGMAASSS